MRRSEIAVFMSFCELCFILIMMTCEVLFLFLLLLFCLCFDDDILGSSDSAFQFVLIFSYNV